MTIRISGRRRHAVLAGMFMLPIAAVNGLVILGPGVQALWYSMTDWTGLGGANFVGLANYRQLLTDTAFRNALMHNVVWTLFFLTVPMAMGIAGAFLLSRVRRFQLALRMVIFLPYVVATVVTAAIWQNLLDPDVGLPRLLGNLTGGAIGDVNPLGDTRLALGSVAFVNNWQWWGFLVVVFLAAMHGVDPSRYEAARLDGANAWQELWHVTLPAIRPTVVFMALMSVIWSFLVFDYIWILTRGGPAGATDVMGTMLYREAFANQNAGYAASIGVLMAAISALVVCGYALLKRRGWEI